MYTREKSCRDEKYKPRKTHNDIPSFSSTLLDEIYRSIDGNAEKSEDFKPHKEKPVKKQSNFRGSNKSREDEEIASFRRACLVEKWMNKEKNEKIASKRGPNLELENNDLLFFSSTSSSSDSSGALSSSDTEFFGSQTKPKVSCFSTRPKPVRTGLKNNNSNPREEYCLFDDYQKNHQKNNKVEQDDLIKYKSRALKIYANLKKVKQPISPGGRLTSFINSIFSNANGKKSKNVEKNNGFQDFNSTKVHSTCSSASSFSRSCLSKNSPKSREKMRNGTQRTVRFHPVSVIVDEDSRACGHKSILDEDYEKYGKLTMNGLEKNRKVEEVARNGLKGYNGKRSDDFSIFRKIEDDEDEDEDDDRMSDSSSDLFELDHLEFFRNNRFREELPVYETTHLDTARRLIR
ncbi:hypothetical protein DH2020_046572 [Rehmannia glutinosa]|uniref:Protein BIG GRAIN 1-like B n=1 Tax=Rehmannia glutinosa TaxID=99300 RepID=A0ABR0UAT0_REHGL